MKKILILFALFFCTINLFAQDDKMNSVTKLVNELKTEFAPDKRVAIFQISVSDVSGQVSLTGETNLHDAKEKLLTQLNTLNINYKDEIKILPSNELGEMIYGLVNLSVANHRTKTDHAAELTTQSLLGTPVKVLKKSSGYFLVQTPDNYISWVDDDGIVLVDRKKLDDWLEAEKIIYVKEYGFSYSSPDVNSLRVSDLAAGNILVKLEKKDGFIKVRYPDGRIAFVKTDECENYSDWLNRKNPVESEIINTAYLMIGVPYLWGGTSAKGMDCSGFTKTVYFLNGIVLYRDADQQAKQGELVDTNNGFENLKPGDLLFFGTHATDSTKERITHVAVYIGNNEYIHAAGRVKINSFDKNAHNYSEYRFIHFIRAKRFLTSIDKNDVTTVKSNKFYRGEFE